MISARDGRIVTFYSYKGGTGRSMALAHAAWITASRGYRVLTIDWDLEAPGLHRYFAPFLADRTASSSDGLIDFLMDYCDAATSSPVDDEDDFDGDSTSSADPLSWVDDYTEIWRYAQPVALPDIGRGGCLHFVSAGRQDDMYGTRVGLFNWNHFYENLGGGAFLNRMRAGCISSDRAALSLRDRANGEAEASARPRYDFVFIDSRTGLSDTSGICTAQLPDTLVCLFTYNVQSIEGASRVLRSARAERAKLIGASVASPGGAGLKLAPLRMIPVPSRAELGDTVRLSEMRKFALPRFAEFLDSACEPSTDPLLALTDVELPYVLSLSYNEVLSLLDEPTDNKSYLGILHALTDRICPDRGPQGRTTLDRAVAKAMWTRYQEELVQGQHRAGADAPEPATLPRSMEDLLQAALTAETDAGRVSVRRVLVSLVSSNPDLMGPSGERFSPYALSQLRQTERDSAERLVRAGILCVRYDSAEEGRVVTPVNGDSLRESATFKAWVASYDKVIQWKREIGLAYARATNGLAEDISLSDAAWEARGELERDFWDELTPREQRIWRVVKDKKRAELQRASEIRQAESRLQEALESGAAGRAQAQDRFAEYRAVARRQARLLAAGAAVVAIAAAAFSLRTQSVANAKVARSSDAIGAWYLVRRGRFSEANAAFSKLIEQYPDDASYYMGRAYTENRRLLSVAASGVGRPQEWAAVARDSEAALQLQVQNKEAIDPDSLYSLSHYYKNAGDTNNATAAFERFKLAVQSADNPEAYTDEIKKGY